MIVKGEIRTAASAPFGKNASTIEWGNISQDIIPQLVDSFWQHPAFTKD